MGTNTAVAAFHSDHRISHPCRQHSVLFVIGSGSIPDRCRRAKRSPGHFSKSKKIALTVYQRLFQGEICARTPECREKCVPCAEKDAFALRRTTVVDFGPRGQHPIPAERVGFLSAQIERLPFALKMSPLKSPPAIRFQQ